MKLYRITPVFALLLSASAVASAQCKAFAKNDCLPELAPYTHDGNYHATTLVAGEEAELYKTFYSDMEYRVAVCGDVNLPDIEFLVMDANKNVLYTNKENNYSRTWDFKPQSSQQLKFVIRAGSLTKPGAVASGCVSIMFGFKTNK
ncbi:MAG: hypothetical protein LBV26_05345 [Bacteroidales bacterium]|jgi:hypothetical protein|nr:hypothetical protein [Bacteroidales bacterium]